MSLSIEALRRRLSACMNLDARRLSSRLHGVKKLPEAKQTAVLETIAADLDAAQARYQSRLAGVPKVTYPANLPVSQKQGEIAKAISEHQVVIHRRGNRFGQNHPDPQDLSGPRARGEGLYRSHPAAPPGGPNRCCAYCRGDGVRAGSICGLQGALHRFR